MKRTTKLLALALAACFMLTLIPATAFASALDARVANGRLTVSGGTDDGSSSTGSGSGSGTGLSTGDSNNTGSTAVIGVTTRTCNFRTGSSTSSAKVSGCSSISSNKQVTILERPSGSKYWKVEYKGYVGWIYASYVKISSGNTGGTGTTDANKLTYAKYTGTSSDRWGTIQVDGTNINNVIYSNAIDSKGNFYYNAYSSSTNYIYALSYLTNPIAVIYGHNMRKVALKQKTNLGLHELHHVQNAWLGKSKCEYCGASCANAKTSVFNISYNGSTKWELVGFFELSSSTMSSSSTRKSMELFAAMQSNRTGSAKQDWVDTMMSYCTSTYSGMKLGSLSGNDKIMVLVTCADKSGDSYQRMYMLLKATN